RRDSRRRPQRRYPARSHRLLGGDRRVRATRVSVRRRGAGVLACCRRRPAYFDNSTSPTLLTPLSAIAILPSFVGMMLRTTPPPPGMIHVWNFSVFGSKRTIVFGRTADSLYQITSFSDVMP